MKGGGVTLKIRSEHKKTQGSVKSLGGFLIESLA